MVTEQSLLIAPYGKTKQEKSFLPKPTQQRVLDWVDKVRKEERKTEGIPVLYLQGGVGSGKTRAILAPVIEMLLETPNLRLFWGRQDFNDLKLSAMETFFEVMPVELIGKKSEIYHWYDIRQKDNKRARAYFSGLKDLGGLGSQEYGVAVVTEVAQISEKAYRTIKQRVRQANMPTMILLEGNPPNKDHWLARLTNPQHKDYDSDIEKWEVSTYENWDNLPLTYRNSLEKMPKSWQNKYLYGHFGFTPDGIPFYEGFKEHLHKRQLNYIKDRPLIRSWDYGYHHPVCTFHQIDAKGRWLILREVMGSEITINKFGSYVKTMCNEWYPNATFEDFGDPAGTQKTDKSERTSVEILASLGIYVTSKSSTYRERKEIIERKLATLIDGLPAVLVDEDCKIAIDGFLGGYHYPQRREGAAFNPAIFEVPYRDGYYEHIMNSMEYFAVNMFTGAETKQDETSSSYKIVGDMKDIKYDEEEEGTNRSSYLRQSQGVVAE